MMCSGEIVAKIKDSTDPNDHVVVTMSPGRTEVWVYVREGGHTSMVMLSPKKARALAKALKRAAKAAS